MASIPVTIVGMDQNGPTTIVGLMSYTGLGPGGGPIVPPSGPVDPGYGYPEKPVDPGYGVPEKPPHIWGPNDPRPTPPIYLPPGYPGDGPVLPPDMKPPEVPPPGTATAVPGNWPSTGIVPPEYVVMQYPGIGPLVVVPPPHAQPAT